MKLPDKVMERMDSVQRTFMQVQQALQAPLQLPEIITLLESHPTDFRSVAYESASMTIGLSDAVNDPSFTRWRSFYKQSKEKHSAHVEVGLGLAFGKLERSPDLIVSSLDLGMPEMVFDGIGYYFGLYKARRTVMYHEVPEFIYGNAQPAFDQGLGRRLWYIAKGRPDEVISLLQSFPETRHSDLWRGLGIACGYVGGNSKENLEKLVLKAGDQLDAFRLGVGMAAISRCLSESLDENLARNCFLIWNKSLKDVILSTGTLLERDWASHKINEIKSSMEKYYDPDDVRYDF